MKIFDDWSKTLPFQYQPKKDSCWLLLITQDSCTAVTQSPRRTLHTPQARAIVSTATGPMDDYGAWGVTQQSNGARKRPREEESPKVEPKIATGGEFMLKAPEADSDDEGEGGGPRRKKVSGGQSSDNDANKIIVIGKRRPPSFSCPAVGFFAPALFDSSCLIKSTTATSHAQVSMRPLITQDSRNYARCDSTLPHLPPYAQTTITTIIVIIHSPIPLFRYLARFPQPQ
jgi:hypothetical protein